MKKWLLLLSLISCFSFAADNTARLGLMMPDAGDEDWDVPILTNYNILDSSVAIIPVDLGSDVTGVLGSSHLVSTVAYTNVQNVFTTQQDFTTITASSASFSGNVNIVGLTSGQCVQAGTGGLLATSGASCGGGSGTSTLGVNQNGVQITSPTKALNGLSPPFVITSVGGGTTAQWALDGSSVTLFGHSVIKLQSSLQSGATFFVSSGTIAGPFRVSTITATNNITADNLRVTGTGGVTVDGLTSGRCVQTTTGGLLTVADAACNTSTTNYSQSFSAVTSVVLTHNYATNDVIVSCYDNSAAPLLIGFDSLEITDTNSVTVRFASSQSGTCVVAATGGGGDNLGSHTATRTITAGYGISASTMVVSSGTVSDIVLSTISLRISGQSDFAMERCGREIQYTATTSSATTMTTFVPTNLSGAITLHSTNSYVKVKIVATASVSASNIFPQFTIFRNGSNILASNGGVTIGSVSGGQFIAPVPLVYDDTPATTGSVTYALAMLTPSGTVTTTNNFTHVLTLQECY